MNSGHVTISSLHWLGDGTALILDGVTLHEAAHEPPCCGDPVSPTRHTDPGHAVASGRCRGGCGRAGKALESDRSGCHYRDTIDPFGDRYGRHAGIADPAVRPWRADR